MSHLEMQPSTLCLLRRTPPSVLLRPVCWFTLLAAFFSGGVRDLAAAPIEYELRGQVTEVNTSLPNFSVAAVGDDVHWQISFDDSNVADRDPEADAGYFIAYASDNYQAHVTFSSGLSLRNSSQGSTEVNTQVATPNSFFSVLLFSVLADDGKGGGDMRFRLLEPTGGIVNGTQLPATLAGSQLAGTAQLFMVYSGAMVTVRMNVSAVPEPTSTTLLLLSTLAVVAPHRRKLRTMR